MPELIWHGKYDAHGKRNAPVRVALPFQTVETVNESAQERQMTLERLFSGRDAAWRNRLIWGDKKYVLPSLLPELAGQVDLIYIDPPFDTGADFSYRVQIEDEDFVKEPSIIEQKAYRDTWGVSPAERQAGANHLDKYLQWFYETAVLLRELLSDTGSIYVHVDWRVSSGVRLVLDEVFGADSFTNELIWQRTSARSDSKTYNHIHDTLFFYRRGDGATWNRLYEGHTDRYVADKYTQTDPDGRRYQLTDMTSPNPRPNMMYEWLGFASPEKGWRYERGTMQRLHDEGRIWYPDDKTRRPRLKKYLDEMPGRPLQSIWSDIYPVNSQATERVGYPTQKPEALLERIIKASSNESDLVLDCFAGSGTTAAVAEKLGRRWITCDLSRFAVHTTRKRLLSLPDVRPFVVQNLGKYERQVWQKAEFGEQAEATLSAYRRFILDLYHARPIAGYAWLHGLKGGRLVHVGAVDSPVTPGDVAQMAAEFRRALGSGEDAPTTNGLDVLGWDFAFEMNEVAKQQASEAKLNVRFLRIPREVMEQQAVVQGDVQFFELASLQVDVLKQGRAVTLRLSDFMVPPDDVPDEVRQAVTRWEQWIDYWAVDWDNQSDTFHNQWQSYRTRKDRSLQTQVAHEYDKPGTYRVVVKVIDILGNDTTKTMVVEV